MGKRAREAKPEERQDEALPPVVDSDTPVEKAPEPASPADLMAAQLRAQGIPEHVIAQQVGSLGLTSVAPPERKLLVGEYVRRLGSGPIPSAFASVEKSLNGHRRLTEAKWRESYDSFCKAAR